MPQRVHQAFQDAAVGAVVIDDENLDAGRELKGVDDSRRWRSEQARDSARRAVK